MGPANRTVFVIKAEVSDPRAETFEFRAQKTMYRGRSQTTGPNGRRRDLDTAEFSDQ